jgi:S1-C subfamily serine protease/pSer/pThr/pTyr-binding forkhead associated (FHA) protein
MRLTVEHMTGERQGQTEVVDSDTVTFGTDRACRILLGAGVNGTVSPIHAEIAVEDAAPTIRDRSQGKGLLVNGESVPEASLRDGDLVQFGEGGPRVRLRFPEQEGRGSKPLRTIVEESREIFVRTPHPRFLSGLYLARHVLRDIVVHASPLGKLAAALFLLAPLLIMLVLGTMLLRQQRAAEATKHRMIQLISQLQSGVLSQAELEQRIEEERRISAEQARRQEAEIAFLTTRLMELERRRGAQSELSSIREQLGALHQARSSAVSIAQRFERNVGLLQGGYGFRERRTGRPLRYQGLDKSGEPAVDENGNALVTVEGDGIPVVIHYAGTAFLIDESGTVVTNRHLVRMWETFEPARQAVEAGFEPDVALLRLFLPGQAQAHPLSLVALSESHDLAVLKAEGLTGTEVAPLLLHEGAVQIGEPIVMLSYPGSVDVLLARAPALTTKEVMAAAGRSPVTLVEELARQGLIRPLVTQGHVSDLSSHVLTYEAVSGLGSSGAPIFNQSGAVIGVNHATLSRVGGIHLGLPVRLVKELLDQGKGR